MQPTGPVGTPTPSNASVLITNDLQGLPLIRAFNMAPGQSAGTNVTVRNGGSLPFSYSLAALNSTSPKFVDPQQGLQLEVKRVADNAVLYQGPMAQATGPLGVLSPGGSAVLHFSVWLPSSVGNDYQGQGTTWDFLMTATSDLSQPTNTPLPTATTAPAAAAG